MVQILAQLQDYVPAKESIDQVHVQGLQSPVPQVKHQFHKLLIGGY